MFHKSVFPFHIIKSRDIVIPNNLHPQWLIAVAVAVVAHEEEGVSMVVDEEEEAGLMVAAEEADSMGVFGVAVGAAVEGSMLQGSSGKPAYPFSEKTCC